MNKIEILKEIAQSLDGYDFLPPTDAPETITVQGEIIIQCQVEQSRQDEKPSQGTNFTFFKPKALTDALKRRKTEAAKAPHKLVQSLAPDWLKKPALNGKKTSRTDILAFRKDSEKVVDRIETISCRSCRGNGSVQVTRTESTSVPCLSCGGAGSRSVTTQIYSPGTTDHGAPRTELRACSLCGGSGNASGPSKTVTETQTCGRCQGSGGVQKTIHKQKTFYETFRVTTALVLVGKERSSKTIQNMRKHTGSQKVSLTGLLKICPSPVISVTEKKAKIRLSTKITLPISARTVTRNKKVVGTVYTIPEDGSVLSISSTAFFDPGMKQKTRQISRLGPEEFTSATTEDFVLRELLHAIENKRTKLVEEALSWSVSPPVFDKAIKATRRSMRKGKGFLSRIGLR